MSADTTRRSPALVEPGRALDSYLEALLAEVPAAETGLRGDPAEAGGEDRLPTPGPVPQVPPATPEPAPAPGNGEGIACAEHQAQPFQCLRFKVAGVWLAVPLIKLHGVIPWQAVTPLPNHSAKFLGLVTHHGRQVKVIDTARVVMPEQVREGRLAPMAESAAHIILVGEGHWGLACDGIGEVLRLEPRDVRWRTRQGKRPWLAGTVLEHLCALLDTDALVSLLEAGQRG